MANFRLVMRSGTSAGKEYPLEKNELFIGRDMTNDVVINDPEVSRRHARLSLQGNAYVVEDLASTNGTSVNGQRLMGPHLLRPGEVITLGEHTNLVYESLQPVSEATMMAGGAAPGVPQKPPVVSRPPAQREPASQPPAYAGKIPVSAPSPIPPPPPKKKSNSLVVVIVVIIVLIVLCACLIIGGLTIIDSTNSWCVFKPVLDIFLPGRCP